MLSEKSSSFYQFIFWVEVLRCACYNHLKTSAEETLGLKENQAADLMKALSFVVVLKYFKKIFKTILP